MGKVSSWACLLGIAVLCGCSRSAPIGEIRSAGVDVTAAADVAANPGDWPWWRGPGVDAVSDVEHPPTSWSTTENVVWKTQVPGRGHSTPIVVGERVFLTTADEAAQEQLVLGYNRASGEELWRTSVHQGSFMSIHPKNSHASATLACDGERLFAAFIHADGLWLTALDLAGEIIWQREAGPFRSEHGYGSSPALYKSLVIVSGDNAGSSFIAALDRESGEIVWRTARERPGRHGSYATPIVRTVAGRPQVLLAGHGKLTSYDPATGEPLWHCNGPCEVAACTVACSEDVVFASGGYPEKVILAVRGDGSGNVNESHVLWRITRGATYVPSPLYHAGHLYVVDDQGVAACYTEDGAEVWRKRLGGNFSASPTLAGGLLYATNEVGTTYVFKAAREYDLVARNDLGDGGFASPVICGDRLYLRTNQWLYCVGE